MSAGLLLEKALDRWVFAHALVRDALVSGWSISSRARVHGRAFEILRERRPEAVAQQALHADHAGSRYRAAALELFRHWGGLAARNYASSDAALAFGRACALTDELHPDDVDARVSLRVALARAQEVSGLDTARDTVVAAAKIAAEADRADLLATCALVALAPNGPTGMYDVDDERIAMTRAALEAQPAAAVRLIALLKARLASLLIYADDIDHSVEAARSAIELARALGDTP